MIATGSENFLLYKPRWHSLGQHPKGVSKGTQTRHDNDDEDNSNDNNNDNHNDSNNDKNDNNNND